LAYINTHMEADLDALINGCLSQQRSSQEQLYKLLFPKMMAMVRRYVDYNNYHLAEEILNNGFLKIFQKIDSYKFEGSFEGWCRRIVFNSMADYLRSHVKYSKKTLFVEKDELVDNNIASKFAYNDLIKLINQLPETNKVVFNMYAIDGYTHKQIAEHLNISEGTSKWHLFEARKVLKQKIEKLSS
jgi:RNA polymerase sigma factor (sigma-70 family)